jgi:hypothetical protein
MYRIICRISGGHVVVREYLALRFLNDCSEFSYTRLVLLETEKSKKIIFNCDNMAVVSILNNKSSKNDRVMSFLRKIAY